VYDSNSAAQVSIRLYAGTSPSSTLRCRTTASPTPKTAAISASLNPVRFIVRSRSGDISRNSPSAAMFRSSTISANCCRNQRSMFVRSCSSSIDQPRRSARNSAHIRRSFGTTRRLRSADSSSSASAGSCIDSGKRLPNFPSSSDRTALRNASLNVRPIAIASPTDFICVVSVRSACGNFSKFQRGNFTTM
jgi:hypothetical protein